MTAPRMVVEHRLDRRVGVDAAVPIRLAVDPDRGERGRQRARGHDVLEAERLLAAVEVAHLARAHAHGADRQSRLRFIENSNIHQLAEGVAQRRGVVPGRGVESNARLSVGAPGHWARREEGRDAARERGVVAERRILLDAPPELAQARQPVLARVARDEAGVERADRGADDPVGLGAGPAQRLVHAGLVGAERAAALQHEDHLAFRARPHPLRRVHSAVQPPSIESSAPVIEAASSMHRNAVSPATCSTVTNFLVG
jgi:hypothetical protein